MLPAPEQAVAVEVASFSARNCKRAALLTAVWLVSLLPMASGLVRCSFAQVFHIPCPGCGMTRAGLLLLHGHWWESLRMNPLTVPAGASQFALAALVIWVTARDGSPTRLWQNALARALSYVLLATLAMAICVWIARFFGLLGGPVPV
jgi:hypothetical protein